MRYLAVVDCKAGHRLVCGAAGTWWEYVYNPCTIGDYDTYAHALAKAVDVCIASPRDCRNPRVEERNNAKL